MEKTTAISVALLTLASYSHCMAAESMPMNQQQPQDVRYAEKYTGIDFDVGVGYSALIVRYTEELTETAGPLVGVETTQSSSRGAGNVAVQARLGLTYGIANYWIMGVDGYGQYNAAAIKSELFLIPDEDVLLTQTTKFTAPWNAGIQGRLGFVYKPSNMVFVYGGPDWVWIKNVYNSTLITPTYETQSNTRFGWRCGAGAEQKFGGHWVMKETVDYGWYAKQKYTHADGVHETRQLDIATAIFSVGYLF